MAEDTKPDMPRDREPQTLPGDIVRIVRGYVSEAEGARATRMALNKRNREILFGLQDWSHKIEGQSTEHIPKISSAIEQFAAFIKRGLTNVGDWFSVELPEGLPITGEQAARLIQSQLDRIGDQFTASGRPRSFSALISDAVKQALLESLAILKVHAGPSDVSYRVMESDGSFREYRPWRVKIDLVPTEHYYPDPTGRNLYEVQSAELDLHEVQALAEMGLLDAAAVRELRAEYSGRPVTPQARSARERGQDEETPQRGTVLLEECWGTLVDAQGRVLHKNVVCTVANKRILVRPPEPNPYWHGTSPFVVSPVIRVPHSVWHRALYDDAAALNIAQNELFNLMLDGGLASVWGIKELRLGMLEDPSQVSGGLRQGMTLILRDDAPLQQPALTSSSTGNIPPEALALYNLLDREFQAASLTNDLKLGMLPPKQVKATEIVEAQQAAGITLDAILQDLESEFIAPLLRKVWLVILQNLEQFDAREISDALGMETTLALVSMPPHVRFNELAQATIKVHGISGMLARARDFQKLLGLLQLVFQSPPLLQVFAQKFDFGKILDQLIRLANIKVDAIRISPAAAAQQALAAQQTALPPESAAGGAPPGPPMMGGMATVPGGPPPQAFPSVRNVERPLGPAAPAESVT